MTQGDLHPPIQIDLSDADSDVDFGQLDNSDYTIIAEKAGNILFTEHPDSKTVAQDGKSVTLLREWGEGETSDVGRIYVRVVVMWPDGRPQTFPAGAPLYLDVRRAAGSS